MKKVISATIPGGDELHLEIELEGESISRALLKFVGCPELAARVVEWRPKLKGQLHSVALPSGSSHADMLLREVLQKANGSWPEIKPNKIVCVCNKLSAKEVDQAILQGATSLYQIQKSTLAGISCTFCQEALDEMIKRRCPRA